MSSAYLLLANVWEMAAPSLTAPLRFSLPDRTTKNEIQQERCKVSPSSSCSACWSRLNGPPPMTESIGLRQASVQKSNLSGEVACVVRSDLCRYSVQLQNRREWRMWTRMPWVESKAILVAQEVREPGTWWSSRRLETPWIRSKLCDGWSHHPWCSPHGPFSAERKDQPPPMQQLKNLKWLFALNSWEVVNG